MAQINGVTVRVSDGIKTADYAPPRLYDLTANVTFQVDDDVDAMLASTVARLRSAGEHFLSGRTVIAPAPDPFMAPLNLTVSKPAKAPEPPKAEEPEPPSNDVSDLLGDPAPKAPPAEITNDEITHAVMKRNDQLKDATKIRALVETYNPAPGLRIFKATEIDQKDRPGFLEKLAAI